jgi:hypothetical protein
MNFRQAEPAGVVDPTNAIEVWEGSRQVATIYAQARGLHVVCEPGYEPDEHGMVIDVHKPGGVIVGLRRS